MFALKLSSVIRYENVEFASLCFNEAAEDVEESGCCFLCVRVVLSLLQCGYS